MFRRLARRLTRHNGDVRIPNSDVHSEPAPVEFSPDGRHLPARKIVGNRSLYRETLLNQELPRNTLLIVRRRMDRAMVFVALCPEEMRLGP
jgi:hypothetical protein